jgi:hypothetical protein
MFEEQVGGPTAATTLSLVAEAHHAVLLNECRLVELAAHWADLHHPASQAPVEKRLPGAEQGRQLGGDGTPEVLEFAAAEFGARTEISSGSARALMADALDLRHRLPELWQLIMTGGVPAWKARKVAQATRHLSRDSAMQVDAAVARAIISLPWGRIETLLGAKIIEADPRAAEEQAKIWEAERFVRSGRTNQSGLKLLIAKANAGDVIYFLATINRIAEILKLQGDMESVDVRRSKAIGILAQPALALQLLWEFRNEQHPAPEPQQPTNQSTTNPMHRPRRPPLRLAKRSSAGRASELIIQPPKMDMVSSGQGHCTSISARKRCSATTMQVRSGRVRRSKALPITLGQVRGSCWHQLRRTRAASPDRRTCRRSTATRFRGGSEAIPADASQLLPYAAHAGRLELDHTSPIFAVRGGPPGQTGVASWANDRSSIGEDARPMAVRQPESGVWIWRSPNRAYYLVTNAGTYSPATDPSHAGSGTRQHHRADLPWLRDPDRRAQI